MSSPLADFIQRGESGRSNYNAYNRGVDSPQFNAS
ncbi:hypothetical protein NCPPB1935_14480 [Xanthomonas campestris pv. nigromaculans]|nr:hypothetical protein NCPPB1935_14480 [Xanthomonas campestris pv. nigromaculans]